jgi:hypothetical protein
MLNIEAIRGLLDRKRFSGEYRLIGLEVLGLYYPYVGGVDISYI